VAYVLPIDFPRQSADAHRRESASRGSSCSSATTAQLHSPPTLELGCTTTRRTRLAISRACALNSRSSLTRTVPLDLMVNHQGHPSEKVNGTRHDVLCDYDRQNPKCNEAEAHRPARGSETRARIVIVRAVPVHHNAVQPPMLTPASTKSRFISSYSPVRSTRDRVQLERRRLISW